MKKLILIDLDWVLNEYCGEYDENYIPPIRKGAFDFIKELSKSYRIKVFTSRKLTLTAEWLRENNLSEYVEDVTNIKLPNYVMIDDRCINFSGNYIDLKSRIDKFSPWYK